MEKKLAVVTDSTADIPPEYQESLNIVVVPAVLTLDGESFKDGLEISPLVKQFLLQSKSVKGWKKPIVWELYTGTSSPTIL